jgi:ribonucleoside-diphosphate reductase beta chain
MSNNRNLFTHRQAYKPFEYPEFNKFTEAIRKTYWEADEIDFTRDVKEFKNDLNDTERYVIGTILKTFAQTEIHVADEFWAYIYKFFPKPEIFRLCLTNAENEMRHADAYDRLNQELGLQDYATFLEDEVAKNRLKNLMSIRQEYGSVPPSIPELARTIVVFALTENVNLFSQFAILKSFGANGRNLLPNISNIIDWSQQDEKTHALAGILLFNIIIEENPDIWSDSLKADIYFAAKLTYSIEKDLINQIFEKGDLINLTRIDLLNYMRNRINKTLNAIGLKSIYEVEPAALERMNWFENESTALMHTDFFHAKPTEYTKNLAVYNSDLVAIDVEKLHKLTHLQNADSIYRVDTE